jgi:hypothetical protein
MNELQTFSSNENIQDYRHKWMEHVKRMNDSRPLICTLNYRPAWRQNLGSPRERINADGTGNIAYAIIHRVLRRKKKKEKTKRKLKINTRENVSALQQIHRITIMMIMLEKYILKARVFYIHDNALKCYTMKLEISNPHFCFS